MRCKTVRKMSEYKNHCSTLEWSVVKFVCDDKISHVPTTWLSDIKEDNMALCFWPQKNAGKHINSRSAPDSGSWDQLEVVILKQSDSSVEAREYLRLMSEGESAPEIFKPLGKGCRKQKKRNRLYDSEYDSDEDTLTGLITPPPTMNFTNTQSRDSPPSLSLRINRKLDSNEVTKTTIFRTISTEVAESITLASVSNDGQSDNTKPVTNETNNCSCNIEGSALLKSILTHVMGIKTMVERLTSIENITDVGKNVINDFDLVPKKPFRKYRKLIEMDEKLKADEKMQRQNETALFLLGGANLKELIRRGLKKLFTDKLAMKCSWTGRKNNFPLYNLKIMELLKIACRKKFGVTDAEFQAEVSQWFRQAKLRFDRSLNKLNQGDTLE